MPVDTDPEARWMGTAEAIARGEAAERRLQELRRVEELWRRGELSDAALDRWLAARSNDEDRVTSRQPNAERSWAARPRRKQQPAGV